MSRKQFLMVRMPESNKTKLKADADNLGISMSSLVEILINSCPPEGPQSYESEEVIRSGVTLSPTTRATLQTMSESTGRSCSSIVNQLIREFRGIEVRNEN